MPRVGRDSWVPGEACLLPLLMGDTYADFQKRSMKGRYEEGSKGLTAFHKLIEIEEALV